MLQLSEAAEMALKLPEQDSAGKRSGVIQLICFIALFLLIYLPLRTLTYSLLVRIAMMVGVYILDSIIVFVFLRPFMLKQEEKRRNRK